MDDLIRKYFPGQTPDQYAQFEQLTSLYTDWNSKINVISRLDIDNLQERHVLHSLAIAHLFTFKPGAQVLDLGTGGGFPGIPLAIFFPETQFTLVDGTGKKIFDEKGEYHANGMGATLFEKDGGLVGFVPKFGGQVFNPFAGTQADAGMVVQGPRNS